MFRGGGTWTKPPSHGSHSAQVSLSQRLGATSAGPRPWLPAVSRATRLACVVSRIAAPSAARHPTRQLGGRVPRSAPMVDEERAPGATASSRGEGHVTYDTATR